MRASGTITAQGRTSSSDTGYFVFDKAKVILGTGASSSVRGTVYLGRPWGDYARVVFQNSDLGNNIIGAGWEPWTSSQATGNILFGGIDNSKFNGDLTILPLQSDTETNSIDTFTVTFAGLEITGNGGKSVYTTTSTAPVILDSGTTLTYLPDNIANAIAAGVGAVNNADYGVVVPCELASTAGVFKFKFGDANGPVITASISQFVLPFAADSGSPAPKFKNGKTACRWGILAADGNPNLFGDTFLRSAYVVYNIEGLQVGIAQTNFNVSDTDIKQITATSSLPGASSTASGVAQQTRTGAIYNTAVGGLASGASTAVASATGGTGTFDLGSATASSSSSSSTGKKSAASGLPPPTSFVPVIVTGLSVLFAMVGGSMLVFV